MSLTCLKSFQWTPTAVCIIPKVWLCVSQFMATSPGSPVCPLLLQHACIYKHTHSHTHISSRACAHTMVHPNHTMFMSSNLLILSCIWAFVKALLSAWNALPLLQRDDCYRLSTLSLMSSPLGSFCGTPSLR